MVAPRKAAFAEESAEVEVLFANMEKLKGLTKKIQGSLNRLESSGKSVQDAIAPIYSNTQRLQVTNSNIDKLIDAIDRIREPLDHRNREERIIQAGPRAAGLVDFMSSLDRTNQALAGLKSSNLRSNQQAIAELNQLIKTGTKQLGDTFKDMIREDTHAVEPLHFITKQLPFPTLPEDKLSKLRLINNHMFTSAAQKSKSDVWQTPTAKIYAQVRGEYLTTSLRNLAAASVTTARKTTVDAIYKKGTSGIGTYALGMEGMFVTEYDNICPIFMRDEWGRVYASTCDIPLKEFNRTLQELNTHIRNNLITDCFLGYEIIEIVSKLSIRLESKTGELKRPLADSLKPVRDTAKASLSKILEETKSKVQNLVALPMDAAPVSVTTETMTRLQTMTDYLSPLSSIMTSLGDGGWSAAPSSTSASMPSLKSFDVGADGGKLFANYALDVIEALLSQLDKQARNMLKSRTMQGVFLANNVAVVDRMIRSSELQPLLSNSLSKLEAWRKKATAMYLEAWREPSSYLLDVQYTNRGGRPTSSGATDSAAVLKGLGSKEKDQIKEKFRNFNVAFDELVSRHKTFKMEKEVRTNLAREVQVFIEPLYGRFWDRYHEVDKGKGKYVKYEKGQLGSILASLA